MLNTAVRVLHGTREFLHMEMEHMCMISSFCGVPFPAAPFSPAVNKSGPRSSPCPCVTPLISGMFPNESSTSMTRGSCFLPIIALSSFGRSGPRIHHSPERRYCDSISAHLKRKKKDGEEKDEKEGNIMKEIIGPSSHAGNSCLFPIMCVYTDHVRDFVGSYV